jgi:hypothetical protein
MSLARGFISLFSLIGSLFLDIRIYAMLDSYLGPPFSGRSEGSAVAAIEAHNVFLRHQLNTAIRELPHTRNRAMPLVFCHAGCEGWAMHPADDVATGLPMLGWP